MSEWDGPPAEGNQHRGAESDTKGAGRLEDTRTLVELDSLASHIDGAFVICVRVTGEPVRYRRRCFLTAASAQRAADRATARGENATVYLAELKPLYRLVGGDGE